VLAIQFTYKEKLKKKIILYANKIYLDDLNKICCVFIAVISKEINKIRLTKLYECNFVVRLGRLINFLYN
jgi:hypothetical protein